MIRVLHYGMGSNAGGIETYLLNLVRTLDPTDVHSDFLYTDAGQEPVFASELRPLGCRFFGVTPRRVNPLRNRRDLADLFGSERVDVLHFHANTISYVEPVRAALRHGVRVVLHSHNAGASRSRATRLLHAWHRRTLPWSRVTRVAVSREAGRWMFGQSRPFEVIHNGIDADAFAFRPESRAAVRRSLGIAEDTFVVGQVGAFLPAKNHTFTLAVFAELVRERPDARLVLIGTGPEEPAVRQRADALGLRDRVRFLGRRADVADVLSALDAMLLPSLHEGFPLVALEAQASGLPCVISDAVTPEVAVTPLCRRLRLTVPPSAWAQQLLASPIRDRAAAGATAQASGCSVGANTAAVAAVYRQLLDSPA